MLLKKSLFDVCGGDCASCSRFNIKNLANASILTKRKVTKKYVPPDMVAIKMIFEKSEDKTDLKNLSDEDLNKLKDEVIKSLEDENDDKND